MQELTSKIAYSEDTWTTKNMTFSFSGTLAHFISEDWKLVVRLVDFSCVGDDEHQGIHAARAFVKSAASRGGLDKICLPSVVCLPQLEADSHLYIIAMVMDNASPNDVCARTLTHLLWARYHIGFHEDNHRIRCMAHVINLIVQAILHALDEADDPTASDHFELHKNEPIHLDDETAERIYGMLDEEVVAALENAGSDAEDEDENDDGDWTDDEMQELLRVVDPSSLTPAVGTKVPVPNTVAGQDDSSSASANTTSAVPASTPTSTTTAPVSTPAEPLPRTAAEIARDKECGSPIRKVWTYHLL